MTLGSKEHDELIEMFERVFKGQFRLDKEPKEYQLKGHVYQNDQANLAFIAFRHGYAFGRATA